MRWLSIFILAALGGCARLPPEPLLNNPLSAEACYTTYILTDPGFEGSNHSGWAIPMEVVAQYSAQLPPAIARLLEQNAEADYLSVEWGEQQWWLENNHNRARALLLPTASVIGVGVVRTEERRFHFSETQYLVQLNGHEMHNLVEYINQSFARDEHKDLISLEAPEGDHRMAFAGARPYSLMNICHAWTVNALNYKDGPLEDIKPVWSRTELLAEMRRLHGPQRNCP